MIILILGFFLAFSQPSFADSSPRSHNEFCLRAADLNNFKQIAAENDNRLSFENAGGIFNQGVSWWHSRFQRSATYLAVFRPDLSKATEPQALAIIQVIMKNSHVVEIPGYASLEAFSKDWQPEIQDALEHWQRRDTILGFAWVRGLVNSRRPSAAKLESMMQKLYVQVEENSRITDLKLQLKGIRSHSWLVVGMEEVPSGYMLQVIDSNFKDLVHYKYTKGDKDFADEKYGRFFPYIEQSKDFLKIGHAIHNYCVQ